MDSRYDFMNGVEEMSSTKMVVSDHQMKVLKYENGDVHKLDSFVVDLKTVSIGADNLPTTTCIDSRITRGIARKIPQRSIEKKFNDRDALTPSSSPKAAQAIDTPQKSPSSNTLPMASQDNSLHNQFPQHQITIKTGGMNAIPEGRLGRRSSFKRSPPSWYNDPKRILLFFATMSSMGTMLLILFTLFRCKRNEKGGVLDWQ